MGSFTEGEKVLKYPEESFRCIISTKISRVDVLSYLTFAHTKIKETMRWMKLTKRWIVDDLAVHQLISNVSAI